MTVRGVRTVTFGALSVVRGVRTVTFGALSVMRGVRPVTFGALSVMRGVRPVTFGALSVVRGVRPVTFGALSVVRGVRPVAFGAAMLAVACTPARPGIQLPDGAGVPLSDYAPLWESVSGPCRGVRTMEFLLVLGGRTGDTTLRRTRMRAAADRSGSLRIEALAPFGAPVFVFVARGDAGTLLLPRERQVVRDARAADVLHALAGLALGPGDVHALLTGCLEPDPVATAARRHREGTVAVELQDGATAYLRDAGDGQVVVAGRRGNLTVEYTDHVRGLPRRLRIQVEGPRGGTDLTAGLSQVNMNTELHPAVFAIDVPAQYTPVTLAGLRGTSPLEQPAPAAAEAAARP